MSKAATLAICLKVTGDGENSAWAPTQPVLDSNSPGGSTPAPLSAGLNVFAIPAGAQGFVFAPFAGSTSQKSLKTVSGDTGMPCSMASPTPFDWLGSTSPPTNLYITSASAETGGTIYWV